MYTFRKVQHLLDVQQTDQHFSYDCFRGFMTQVTTFVLQPLGPNLSRGTLLV